MNRQVTAVLGVLLAGMASQAMAVDDERGSVRRFYGYACFGGHDGPDRVGDWTNEGEGTALAFGIGRRFNRYLAGEGDVLITGETYDAPGYTGDGEPTVSLVSVAYSLRASLPQRRFRPFVTAGVGFFQADVQFVDEDAVGWWGYGIDKVDSDKGFETLYGLGFDVSVGRRSWLGIEYRRLDADADIEGESVDLSGSTTLFTWRYDFGKVLERQ
jgi:hypothetical protein